MAQEQVHGSDSVILSRSGGDPLSLPLVPATEGAPGADVSRLLSTAGLVTYDPGYGNTAACTSTITYIDGDAGILRYRGYPIEALAGTTSFIEVSYLLIYGELPDAAALDALHRADPAPHAAARGPQAVLRRLPARRAPDAGAVLARCPRSRRSTRTRSTRTTPSRWSCPRSGCSRSCRRSRPTRTRSPIGQPFLYPDNSLDLVENFLRMTFGFPAEPYEVDPAMRRGAGPAARSCTPTTSRTARPRRCGWSARPQANLFASVSAGINALFGPLHGGANQAVLEMLEAIQADGGDVDDFVREVKDRKDGVRLMGFGHRVYKNYDPRAAIVKKTADSVLSALGKRDDAAGHRDAARGASRSPTTTSSRASSTRTSTSTPGCIYRAMGFPTRMFTVLFALGRLPGWIAQWREMMDDPHTRIGRPRQLYVGAGERSVVPIADR